MIKDQINRTPEMIRQYRANQQLDSSDTIEDLREVYRDYTHWQLVENKFPYDAVFQTHHMLISKRIFPNLFAATSEEITELNAGSRLA